MRKHLKLINTKPMNLNKKQNGSEALQMTKIRNHFIRYPEFRNYLEMKRLGNIINRLTMLSDNELNNYNQRRIARGLAKQNSVTCSHKSNVKMQNGQRIASVQVVTSEFIKQTQPIFHKHAIRNGKMTPQGKSTNMSKCGKFVRINMATILTVFCFITTGLSLLLTVRLILKAM